MASTSHVLYVGMTNDLTRRVYQHRHGLLPGFTSKYRVRRLVYYEMTTSAYEAVSRERQLKSWRRSKKLELIAAFNPKWLDLGDDLLPGDPSLRSG